MAQRDHYAALGILPDASQEDVKKAYRAAVMNNLNDVTMSIYATFVTVSRP